MTTKRPAGIDPFQRAVPASGLGAVSNIVDNTAEEEARIANFIPSQATMESGVAALDNLAAAAKPAQRSIFQVPYTPIPDQDNSEELPSTPLTVHDNTTDQTPEHVSSAPSPTTDSTDTEEEAPPEFEDSEVLPILDALLTQGCAKYTFNIRGIDITLRSQYLWEDQMLVDYVDRHSGPGVNLRATGSFYYEIYSLACNIERVGGSFFPCLSQGRPDELTKSFEERVAFLKTLPSALITMISLKRIDFLKRVQFVIQNFERLIKVF